MAELFDTLGKLIVLLFQLVGELGLLALHWWAVLLWFAWWLWGVNWQKVWPFLARGAWVPFALLVVLVALVWSQIAPSSWTILGALTLPNFWWQLLATSALAGIALFCGWLQGVMGWTPADMPVDPPAHVEAGHGHTHP